MKHMARAVWSVIFILGLVSSPSASGGVPVVFLNPGAPGDVFFQPMTDFMQAAAEDLGFELDVYYGNRNHVLIDENVEKLFSRKKLPRYVLGMNARGGGESFLARAEAAGVETVFINQGFLEEDQKNVGRPGEKYTRWLFEYLPNDTQAGYVLAKKLIQVAVQDGLVDGDGMVNVIAVSGHEASPASILREKGLQEAVAEFSNTRLRQVVHADWKQDRAKELSKRLMQRYPDTAVVWSASDAMAEGVLESLNELGKRPGTDVLIGGVDWTARALELVKEGEFTVSVGGHFMDGGWALVMLYDAMHGVEVPRSSLSRFFSLTRTNIYSYHSAFDASDWRKIDFTKFSKYLNPTLEKYNFGLEAVLDQVEVLRP